jgi:hypothetical protein
MSKIHNLANLSKLWILWSNSNGVLTNTYFFDWVNDFLVRDASDSATLTATTSLVMSCWCKPNVDSTDTPNSQPLIMLPLCYIHIRNTNNQAIVRYDNAWSRVSFTILWTWYRNKVHIIWVVQNNGDTTFTTKIYVNGILKDSDNHLVWPLNAVSATSKIGNYWAWYFSGNIRDARVYTWNISDADAMTIYNWGEPVSATKYLQYWPNPLETGTQALDMSTNARNGTLTGWVTRNFI